MVTPKAIAKAPKAPPSSQPPCSQDIRGWIYFRRFSGMYDPDVEAAVSRRDSARSRSRSRSFGGRLNYRPLPASDEECSECSESVPNDGECSECSSSPSVAPPPAAAPSAAAFTPMAVPMAPPPAPSPAVPMPTRPPMSTSCPTSPPGAPAGVFNAGGNMTIVGPIIINYAYAHGHTPMVAASSAAQRIDQAL